MYDTFFVSTYLYIQYVKNELYCIIIYMLNYLKKIFLYLVSSLLMILFIIMKTFLRTKLFGSKNSTEPKVINLSRNDFTNENKNEP